MATAKLIKAPPGIVKDRIFASSLAAKMVASELCQVRYFPICVKISLLVFCYQNCSDLVWEKNCSSDREKLLKFKAKGSRIIF